MFQAPIVPFEEPFTKHPQFQAAHNPRLFLQLRLRFYSNKRPVDAGISQRLLIRAAPYVAANASYIPQVICRLATLDPILCVITASRDRFESLARLLMQLEHQRRQTHLAWIIIDNGSSCAQQEAVNVMARNIDWIVPVFCDRPFNYAAPARNFGLLLAQAAFFKSYKTRYVWALDSDDEVHKDCSTKELLSVFGKFRYVSLAHGYSIAHYHEPNGKVMTTATIPRPILRQFPEVRRLKDEFDAGPQLISGVFPMRLIRWFLYPDEFTFEDDTLNRRIMLWSKSHGMKIIGISMPCAVKHFQEKSMSNRNNAIGSRSRSQVLGPTIVTGIRALVVECLLFIRDYFTREHL